MGCAEEIQIKKLWEEYLTGFFSCWIIDMGLRLGLLKAIHKRSNGISAKELAKRLKFDLQLVNVWCKAAYSFKLLEVNEKGNFYLDKPMDLLLIGDPTYPHFCIAPAIENYIGASESFFHFYEAFKTGKTLSFEEMGHFYRSSIEKDTLTMLSYLISSVLPGHPYLRNLANKRAKILDFGCAAGLGMIQYAKNFENWSFVGVDIIQTLIQKAKENIKRNRLEDRIKAKLIASTRFNLGQNFDLIFLTFTLHEIKNKKLILRELLKALKKNGSLVIFEFVRQEDIRELRSFSGRMSMGQQIAEAIMGNILISAREMRELLRVTNYRNIKEYSTPEKILKAYIAQR
ncbi:methyltransferase domain-containing protein [Candidatus Omnitrophota bacterium]